MKVLLAAPHIPYPPTDGGRMRTYHCLREISRRHRVTLLCQGTAAAEELGELRRLCEDVECVEDSPDFSPWGKARSLLSSRPYGLAGARGPFRAAFKKRLEEGSFELAHVVGLELAELARAARHRVRLLWDLVDCASLNYRRRSRVGPDLPRRAWHALQASRFRSLERRVLGEPGALYLVQSLDDWAEPLREITGARERMRVVPNGVDPSTGDRPDPLPGPDRLVFTGAMGYLPNEDAVLYFCQEILPLVRRRRPETRLDVIGKDPSRGLMEACARAGGVSVLGFVEDLRREMSRRAVYACPLRAGTGIKSKVLEALAEGMPVVATPISVEGMPGIVAGEHLLVADTAEGFAQAVLGLLASPELRRRLGEAGRRLVETRYTWQASGSVLEEIYREAAA